MILKKNRLSLKSRYIIPIKKSNHNFRQRISQFPVTVGQSQIFYGDISAG